MRFPDEEGNFGPVAVKTLMKMAEACHQASLRMMGDAAEAAHKIVSEATE